MNNEFGQLDIEDNIKKLFTLNHWLNWAAFKIQIKHCIFASMKKVGKIIVLFQILVLCCFIVSICNTRILLPEISFQNNRSTQENGYSPIDGAYLFTQTTKPENVVNGFKNLPIFSFKNYPNDYLAQRKAAESYLINNWSEYVFFAENIVVRLQPADIIFPFHYFW